MFSSSIREDPSYAIARTMTVVVAINASIAGAASAATVRGDFALRGTLVTPTEIIADGVVGISADRIQSVSAEASADAIVVDGVIFPGLVDLHNHLTWNVLPRWTPSVRFGNRYEWQEDPEYALSLSGPHNTLTAAGLGCDMNRYAEIKAIVNGATAGVGGFPNPAENGCIAGLLRNLDLASDLSADRPVNAERLRNVVYPFESDARVAEMIRAVDPESVEGSGVLRAVVMHAGEGVDAASRREFRMLRAHGFLRRGVSVAHGVAFESAELSELAVAGVGLLWSPRSNIELYGRTTDVLAANAARVTIAIAPDWAPTGSAGMLDELATAWKLNVGQLGTAFTDADMFRMASSNPALLAGLPGRIGSLEPGAMADLLVLRRKPRTAYQAIVRSSAADVMLVTVGGQAIYGDPALMTRLLPGVQLESVDVCGENKLLDVSGGLAELSFAAVSGRLRVALASIGSSLAPLAECN